MNVVELVPSPRQKVEFSAKGLKFVPKKTGCYVLTSFHNEIIYLGLAKNLFSRSYQHLENPEKNEITILGRIYWFYYIELQNEKEIYQTERGWLNLYELNHGELPPLNKIHSPVR